MLEFISLKIGFLLNSRSNIRQEVREQTEIKLFTLNNKKSDLTTRLPLFNPKATTTKG